MSLFKRLQRLYRPDRFLLEDFHTEIVAQVLINTPELALAWLSGIGATTLGKARLEILTQEEYPPLEGHATSSRPDITVRLIDDGRRELVFIESKLPSTQGDDQLQRYAEHAAAAMKDQGMQNASLVFITRDYEAAELPKLTGVLYGPKLIVTRWFHFYRLLKSHPNEDGLINELKHFMEENHMSLGHQFRATDVVALENFMSAKALMDETLKGEVSQAVQKIFGDIWPVGKAPNELRDHQRYIVANPNWNDFEFLLGYWLPHNNPDDSVWVGVTFYSKPVSKFRKDLLVAFRSWKKTLGADWEEEALDADKSWSGIYKGRPLHAFMAGEDHVRAIKDYFLGLLKETAVFKKEYPNLPWGTAAEAAADPGAGDDE